MGNLFRFVTLRHVQSKPLRALLTLVGISLGTALVIAVQIINRSTLAAFEADFEAIAGKAALVVTAGEAGFLEDRAAVVAATPGVRHAVPLLETRAELLTEDRAGHATVPETLLVLGVDLLKEQSIRTYKTSDERVIDDPLLFLNQPDSIILTHALAQRRGLSLDRSIDVLTTRGTHRLTVRGLLSPEGPARALGGAIAIMDIDAARTAFGKEGRLDRIDVVVDPGASIDAVAVALRAALGPGYEVQRPSGQSAALGRLVASYQLMVTFFSSLALVVGLFLVLSAAKVAVTERRREIAILRALGASQRGILALFLGESALLGTLGGLAGAGLGRLLAGLMLPGTLEALRNQSFTHLTVSVLQFGARDVAQAVLLGGLASLVATLWAAYTATRIQPVEAMRRHHDSASAAGLRGGSNGLAIGGALGLWLVLSAQLGWGTRHPLVENLNQIVAVVAAALVGPAVVLVLVQLLRKAAARLGSRAPLLRLAGDSLARNPRRTGGNVRTLMIGLVLVVVIATVGQSVERTMLGWLGRVLHADLFVSSGSSMIDLDVLPLHEDFAQALAAVPGVQVSDGKGAYAIRFVHVQYQGQQLGLKAFDPPSAATGLAIFDVLDRPAEAAARDLFWPTGGPTVMVSESFVTQFKQKTGDTLELQTPTGPLRARIVGVMVDFVSNVGVFYLDRALYKKYWRDPMVSGFGIELAAHVDPAAVRAEIDRRYGHSMKLVVASTAELKQELLGTIRRSFGDLRAVQLAALLVGLMGLLNTMLISVLERQKEIGVLRAIGMTERQVIRMILGEALIQGGLGGLVAAVLGAWIASVWIATSLSSLLGLRVQFHFPAPAVVTTVVAGLLVAGLAGLYPARRATRLSIKEALDHE